MAPANRESALPPKEQRKLIKHLESEGAEVIERRSRGSGAVILLLKDGSTASFHRTTSNRRGVMNLRAVIKQAGHTWPTDKEK
jgi:hypothetical protein